VLRRTLKSADPESGHVPRQSALAGAFASCEAREMANEALDITKNLALFSEHWGRCRIGRIDSRRLEKNSVAIASNEWFSGWKKTFTGLRLCAGDR